MISSYFHTGSGRPNSVTVHAAAPGEPRPTVEISLVRGTVFPGEEPEVVIKFTAPKESAVRIFQKEKAHSEIVNILIADESGKFISAFTGEPHEMAPWFYSVLPAGKSLSMQFSADGSPKVPGKYTVTVYVCPTPEGRAFQVIKDLPLTCAEIPPASIKDQFILRVAARPEKNEPKYAVLLMNVETGEGNTLVYRYMEGRVSILTKRIMPLDPDSRIVASVALSEVKGDSFCCVFNEGGKLHFVRMRRFGVPIEQRILGEDFPVPADRGNQGQADGSEKPDGGK